MTPPEPCQPVAAANRRHRLVPKDPLKILAQRVPLPGADVPPFPKRGESLFSQ